MFLYLTLIFFEFKNTITTRAEKKENEVCSTNSLQQNQITHAYDLKGKIGF